jgi:DNA-binding MarR family transcriptional regulator
MSDQKKPLKSARDSVKLTKAPKGPAARPSDVEPGTGSPKVSARESVELTKVETRRQEINLSDSDIGMAKKFESEFNPKGELTKDEITLINIFEKQKLFLDRIAIMVNQTKNTLNQPLLKKADFEALLDSLVKKGLVASRKAPAGVVYYLTEAGLDFLGLI